MTAARRLLAATAAVLLLAACGSDDAPPATADGVQGRVTVFAAASLSEAFTELAARFERDNPGSEVVLSFGASSSLAQQVVSGAPADVFAAASPATMAVVTEAGGAAGEPEVFVRNTLQIAVPKGNPGEVTGLADFGKPALKIALCAEAVPCGVAATKVLSLTGVTAAPDTLEQDVKAALAKVRLGEVDAALVYRTDVLAAGDEVEGVSFPEADQAVNDYPLVALAEAPNPEGAAAFVSLVLSDDGQQVLTRAGFQRP